MSEELKEMEDQIALKLSQLCVEDKPDHLGWTKAMVLTDWLFNTLGYRRKAGLSGKVLSLAKECDFGYKSALTQELLEEVKKLGE